MRKKLLINRIVFLFKYIENYPNICFLFTQKGSHRFHRNLRRFFVGKMKFSCRDTAKSDTMQPVFHGKRKTGAVAAGKLAAVFSGQSPCYDRTDRMNYITCRQVIRRRDLCMSGRLIVSLLIHDRIAGQTKLYTADAVYHVVHTGMTGYEAPSQGAIGSVDDCVSFQACDVSAP